MQKELYVPLSEANCAVNNSRVSLELPYGLSEGIEVNMWKIGNLRRLGGFKSAFISVDSESGTSKTIPQIDGINSDGTAISSKASVKVVPEGSFEFPKIKDGESNRSKWPDLNIKVNVSEIQQRILDSKNNVRDNYVWSQELNQTIKHNILEGGTSNLLPRLSDMSFIDILNSSWFYSINPLFYSLGGYNFKELVKSYFFTEIIFNGIQIIEHGFPGNDNGYRCSLTFGPEIERVIRLNLYGRCGAPIVRARQ